MHRDHVHAALHQPASDQALLTPFDAITLAQLGVFFGNVERLVSLIREQNLRGLLLEVAHRFEIAAVIQVCPQTIELGEQRPTIFKLTWLHLQSPILQPARRYRHAKHLAPVTRRTVPAITAAQVERHGHAIACDSQSAIDHRGDAGMLRFRTQQPADLVLTEAARETKRAVGMSGVAVTHRTNERELFRNLSVMRQQFANVNAWHVRLDGVHRPANFARSIGLHVIRFELTRTTTAPEQNDGRIALNRLDGCLGLQLQQVGQSQAPNPQKARLQERPPRQSARPCNDRFKFQHFPIPSSVISD